MSKVDLVRYGYLTDDAWRYGEAIVRDYSGEFIDENSINRARSSLCQNRTNRKDIDSDRFLSENANYRIRLGVCYGLLYIQVFR